MDSLLELKNVSVHFSGLKALTDVSLEAHSAEIKAVIGPNGAGKTTLFNVISGYVPPTSGEIYLRNDPIHGLTPHHVSERGVRRTFQNGGLFPEMTVLENVLTGLHVEIESSFFGLLLGTRASRDAEGAATDKARRLLDSMDMGEFAEQQVKNLSGGQQRIVEIIRTVATEPPLLLLDETGGRARPSNARSNDGDYKTSRRRAGRCNSPD